MPLRLATAIVHTVTAYLALGLLFVAIILPRLVVRLDDGLRGASIGVRVLIAPGLVLLWPLFATRLLTGTRPPEERNAHRRAAAAAASPGTRQ